VSFLLVYSKCRGHGARSYHLARHQVSGLRRQAYSTRHNVPGTKCQVTGTSSRRWQASKVRQWVNTVRKIVGSPKAPPRHSSMFLINKIVPPDSYSLNRPPVKKLFQSTGLHFIPTTKKNKKLIRRRKKGPYIRKEIMVRSG